MFLISCRYQPEMLQMIRNFPIYRNNGLMLDSLRSLPIISHPDSRRLLHDPVIQPHFARCQLLHRPQLNRQVLSQILQNAQEFLTLV